MRLAVGCVAEPTAKYLDQAERLLQSWRWFAGRYAGADFHVCVVGDVPTHDRARYEKYGAHVHGVSRFNAHHAASNKLRFLELAAAQDAERVVLLDCDTIIVQEPGELFEGESLIAKMADVATVPTNVLHRIFAEFGVAPPPASYRCTVSDEPTIPYFNAGVLSFSNSAMTELVPEWIRYNKMLIERIDMLEERKGFCEQASLSVAVAATKTPFTALGNRMNFPAHFQDRPVTSSLGQTDPVIIHYHWLVDNQGRLQGSPYPNVDRRIEDFNDRAAAEGRA
jgi:hypothetical protein